MFGNHTPSEVKSRGSQGAMSAFTRGIQSPGTQWKYDFPNGYGASVINDGYGGESGLYEVGVFHGGHLTYKTPITDDVLGYLTAEQVSEALDAIAALTEESVVQHQIASERKQRDDRIAELEAELAALKAEVTA